MVKAQGGVCWRRDGLWRRKGVCSDNERERNQEITKTEI